MEYERESNNIFRGCRFGGLPFRPHIFCGYNSIKLITREGVFPPTKRKIMKTFYTLFSESYERSVNYVWLSEEELRSYLGAHNDLIAEDNRGNIYAVSETVLLHKYDNLIFL